jgi:hypothetical protein
MEAVGRFNHEDAQTLRYTLLGYPRECRRSHWSHYLSLGCDSYDPDKRVLPLLGVQIMEFFTILLKFMKVFTQQLPEFLETDTRFDKVDGHTTLRPTMPYSYKSCET